MNNTPEAVPARNGQLEAAHSEPSRSTILILQRTTVDPSELMMLSRSGSCSISFCSASVVEVISEV